jgi:hypothetical protein
MLAGLRLAYRVNIVQSLSDLENEKQACVGTILGEIGALLQEVIDWIRAYDRLNRLRLLLGHRYPHLREYVDYGELEAEYIIAGADLERLKGSIRNGSACYVEALIRNL